MLRRRAADGGEVAQSEFCLSQPTHQPTSFSHSFLFTMMKKNTSWKKLSLQYCFMKGQHIFALFARQWIVIRDVEAYPRPWLDNPLFDQQPLWWRQCWAIILEDLLLIGIARISILLQSLQYSELHSFRIRPAEQYLHTEHTEKKQLD